MEKIVKVEKNKFEEVKEKLLKDEETSKLSLTFREGSIVNDDSHYYIKIQGPEEIVKKALEMIKEDVKEIEEEEEKKVKEKMEEEERAAIEGFGSLF